MEKYDRARQLTHDRHLRTACWITTATDTHSEYEILNRFPRQKKKVFHERASLLRVYVHRLSCFAYGTKTFARIALHVLWERVIYFIK